MSVGTPLCPYGIAYRRAAVLATVGRMANRGRAVGGLVFKAHRLCVSLNSRLESNTEEEEGQQAGGQSEDQVVHWYRLLCPYRVR